MYKGIKPGLSYTSPMQEVAWEGEQYPRRYLLNMICLQALCGETTWGLQKSFSFWTQPCLEHGPCIYAFHRSVYP